MEITFTARPGRRRSAVLHSFDRLGSVVVQAPDADADAALALAGRVVREHPVPIRPGSLAADPLAADPYLAADPAEDLDRLRRYARGSSEAAAPPPRRPAAPACSAVSAAGRPRAGGGRRAAGRPG
ncbi:hypothetical protein OG455_37470 [Kitasatospora sp. NBC_01287]|uniref:hypothetical protein n=1 Tax=Kitasatospora sp. NBC_01287 TaxID=2903573 RepID=UPI00224DCDB1|nr:hypothetical protein [Kitasatospora sp. NBC_01287]MCX4751132.1 hypothetical protein [Kitasatospora sp. NBC_01287]